MDSLPQNILNSAFFLCDFPNMKCDFLRKQWLKWIFIFLTHKIEVVNLKRHIHFLQRKHCVFQDSFSLILVFSFRYKSGDACNCIRLLIFLLVILKIISFSHSIHQMLLNVLIREEQLTYQWIVAPFLQLLSERITCLLRNVLPHLRPFLPVNNWILFEFYEYVLFHTKEPLF